jgi:hypothetical protein
MSPVGPVFLRNVVRYCVMSEQKRQLLVFHNLQDHSMNLHTRDDVGYYWPIVPDPDDTCR